MDLDFARAAFEAGVRDAGYCFFEDLVRQRREGTFSIYERPKGLVRVANALTANVEPWVVRAYKAAWLDTTCSPWAATLHGDHPKLVWLIDQYTIDSKALVRDSVIDDRRLHRILHAGDRVIPDYRGSRIRLAMDQIRNSFS